MLKVARKPKKMSLNELQEAVEYRSLELESRLIESQYSILEKLVDPREAYLDNNGESWMPIGSGGLSNEQAEPFLTQEEHDLIRRRARLTLRRNAYAEGFIVNLQSFIVGKGHQYDVACKPGVDAKTAESYEMELQRFVDKLLKVNKWKRRQKEIVRRRHRDGEAFIRIFPQNDGFAKFRFVEPWQVRTPSGWTAEASASFGVKTEPDDVETVEMYFVEEEEVEAHEIQHRKQNVDSNCKRGLSSIYCVSTNLERGGQLLTNMSQLVQTRAAIGMIRRHNKPASAVRSFAASNATSTIRNPVTQEDMRGKRLRPGSVIDTNMDTEYEFPSLNASAGDGTSVLAAELRAVASSKGLPEYMVGSDASNANYASTMVAESPAVRYFESEQDQMIDEDLELIWAAVDYAIDSGHLRKEVRTMCVINVQAPELVTRDPNQSAQANEIYMRNRVKSPQTVASELGLDSDREQANWTSFDDQNLEGGPLPSLGANPMNDPSYIPPAEDVVAATDPEAALLNMAGGITGYLEIMSKYKEGVLDRAQSVAALRMFFKLDANEAETMMGNT